MRWWHSNGRLRQISGTLKVHSVHLEWSRCPTGAQNTWRYTRYIWSDPNVSLERRTLEGTFDIPGAILMSRRTLEGTLGTPGVTTEPRTPRVRWHFRRCRARWAARGRRRRRSARRSTRCQSSAASARPALATPSVRSSTTMHAGGQRAPVTLRRRSAALYSTPQPPTHSLTYGADWTANREKFINHWQRLHY